MNDQPLPGVNGSEESGDNGKCSEPEKSSFVVRTDKADAIATPNQTADPGHGKKHPLEYATFFAVIIGGIGAVAAALFTFDQFRVASESLDIIRDQEHRQLRAYISVGQPFIESKIAGHQAMEFDDLSFPEVNAGIVVKNTGSTPAFNYVRQTTVSVQNVPLPESFMFAPSKRYPLGYVGPNDHIAATGTGNGVDAYSTDAFDMKWNRTRAIYVYGNVTYRDAFGAIHETTYCFFWLPGGSFPWTMCDKHNEVDP